MRGGAAIDHNRKKGRWPGTHRPMLAWTLTAARRATVLRGTGVGTATLTREEDMVMADILIDSWWYRRRSCVQRVSESNGGRR